jgi:hypothetical protein
MFLIFAIILGHACFTKIIVLGLFFFFFFFSGFKLYLVVGFVLEYYGMVHESISETLIFEVGNFRKKP